MRAPRLSALPATLRLVGKPFFSKELLLA